MAFWPKNPAGGGVNNGAGAAPSCGERVGLKTGAGFTSAGELADAGAEKAEGRDGLTGGDGGNGMLNIDPALGGAAAVVGTSAAF